MKGKVALLVLGVGLLATGCGSAQADGPENISFDDGESSIVVDSKTGVEYIKTEIMTRKGWYYTYCPRFDKDGKPMIYKKGK